MESWKFSFKTIYEIPRPGNIKEIEYKKKNSVCRNMHYKRSVNMVFFITALFYIQCNKKSASYTFIILM